MLEDWIKSCPLSYASHNAPEKRDVLGTWLLSILSGHKRCAHVTTIRGDGVNPGLLGMRKVVSEDSLRRGLASIDEAEGLGWVDAQLDKCVRPLLAVPWVLDVDTTVKCLYGHQEGAVVGYNPKKPGRPSHTHHTYLMAKLRLVLGVDILAGNESHSNHTMPGLLKLIDALPQESRPKLVRGDCGFGNNPVMAELESRSVSYLFKLRLTKNVMRCIGKSFGMTDWSNAGQGWEGRDGRLQLTGWSSQRRVVILRRPLRGDILLSPESAQLDLTFLETSVPSKRYEYSVLVTDMDCDVVAIAQLYRDRGDAENAFDELKNQWGWGRIHDERPVPLSVIGEDRGAGLQLVVAIRASGQPESADGSHHEPAASVVRHCPANKPRWTAVPERDGHPWPRSAGQDDAHSNQRDA